MRGAARSRVQHGEQAGRQQRVGPRAVLHLPRQLRAAEVRVAQLGDRVQQRQALVLDRAARLLADPRVVALLARAPPPRLLLAARLLAEAAVGVVDAHGAAQVARGVLDALELLRADLDDALALLVGAQAGGDHGELGPRGGLRARRPEHVVLERVGDLGPARALSLLLRCHSVTIERITYYSFMSVAAVDRLVIAAL